MPKRSIVALVLVAFSLMVVAPATAIVYGEPDDGRHPYVGAFVLEIDGEFRRICSGSLISTTVFLTAGHCTAAAEDILEPGEPVFVTFDDVVRQTSTFHSGTPHTHPEFGSGGNNDPHDIAVIVLDEPVTTQGLAELPEENLLDDMKSELRDQTFTAVGYGTIRETRKKGPQNILPNLERRMALQSFNALNKAWLRLSMNEATGDGGTCFGDSGGPHFLGGEESNLVVSITVTGDAVCKATDDTYRVDTQSARDFLGDFVALP
ncbi:MAG: S1 family peptidase [Actinomycetota bacterium]